MKDNKNVGKYRIFIVVMLILITAAVSVGGTIAWLTASTDPVENVFTTSDISITLTEDAETFVIVPGSTITKDPVVTVEKGSEASWVFVKVDEANLTDFITYEMADGWLTDSTLPTGVYYQKVAATESGSVELQVLKNDEVSVPSTVTKDMMKTITDSTKPKLTFTAYACQQANVTNVADAWNYASGSTSAN